MDTVSARLDIQVYVDCPNCDNLIDLLDEADTDGVAHNEEGYVLSQACPEGQWIDGHKKFEVEDVTCTNCKHDFTVRTLEW